MANRQHRTSDQIICVSTMNAYTRSTFYKLIPFLAIGKNMFAYLGKLLSIVHAAEKPRRRVLKFCRKMQYSYKETLLKCNVVRCQSFENTNKLDKLCWYQISTILRLVTWFDVQTGILVFSFFRLWVWQQFLSGCCEQRWVCVISYRGKVINSTAT